MLPSGLPESIAGSESLARYLTSRSQFNSSGVKPAAFLPNPKDNKTSVYRHGAEPSDELWTIGAAYVAGERTLYGAAVCLAADVRAAQLEVVAKEPPPRHANIERWPDDEIDPQMAKAKCMKFAGLIAQHANLVRR